ncbi:MAG: MarR family winged helix-turn-helix transcriptional regulator [Bacteroidia bacterium]
MLDRGQLTALFGRIWNMHALRLDQVFREAGLGITADQYRLMHLLWTRNGAHQEFYARKLGRDRSSLTRMLQGLEQQQLLIRSDDPADKRARLVLLTEAGKALEAQVEPLANEVLLQMWDGLASEEREQLNDILSRLRYNLMG